MASRTFPSASALAASLLTAITLLVFWILQDYGPESALRRFHEAIVQRNVKTLDEVTLNPTSADTRDAISLVDSFLVQESGHYRLLGTDRHGRWVGAEVMYVFPTGQTHSIYWVVRKQGNSWMVDPVETAKVVAMPTGRS